MAIQKRSAYELPSPGPFLAKVTNHLDSTYMGSLEVALIKGYINDPTVQSQTYIVNYLSPFYGVTDIKFEGSDPTNFDDVQKSYGMWMVPPDIGTTVMVIFLDGDPNQGFWMGCVLSDRYQNHMVPGIAASTDVAMTAEQKRKYGVDYLPVGEFHNRSTKTGSSNPDRIKKPIHPFADRLLKQGLLADPIRGVTSSSARREVPSAVFGISTPGRLDRGGRTGLFGYSSKVATPVSRVGGHTFVMDDGDAAGDNQLVRIRSSSGHQILLNDSSNLIYIGNADGTAWIEMTAAGKIDIYAEDSISVHTNADFNFNAARDINLEAGRNINIKSGSSLNVNVTENYSLIVGQDGKLQFSGTYDHSVIGIGKITTGEDFHLGAGGSIFESANSDFNISSGGSNKFSTAGDTNLVSGGLHKETASKIHMNGPAGASAGTAIAATQPTPLPLFSLPSRDLTAGWENSNFYKGGSIVSIMQRVPTHEPWPQHENFSPTRFSSDATDVVTGTSAAARTGKVPVANDPLPPPNNDQPADWAKDTSFISKVKEVSSALGCKYIDLFACMAFETGRKFDPALRNSIGATGLIQFISATAADLGTTTDYLASLSRTQQMDWVLKYFKKGPVHKIAAPSLEDLYMAILWPKAVGQLNDYVLFTAPAKNYSQNSGLDIGNKGYITKSDAATKVREQIPYVTKNLPTT